MKAIIAATLLMLACGATAAAATESPAASASPATGHHLLSRFERKKRPAGLPSHWDKRIPLPDGVSVVTVKSPVNAAQAVEFALPGDFDSTVAFYKESLPKAGFQLGPEIKVPARKVYNLNFTRRDVQDTLSIFPDKTDPSKLAMRIVYTPEKGWIRTKLVKWEDRMRVIPRWWRHREEEKHTQAAQAPPGGPAANTSAPAAAPSPQ